MLSVPHAPFAPFACANIGFPVDSAQAEPFGWQRTVLLIRGLRRASQAEWRGSVWGFWETWDEWESHSSQTPRFPKLLHSACWRVGHFPSGPPG